MNNRRNSYFRAVLVAAAAVAAAPTAAAESRVAVSYRDLDLTQRHGIAVLHGRLRTAARAVCGAPQREGVRAYFERRNCYQESIARALRDVQAGRQLVASLQS